MTAEQEVKENRDKKKIVTNRWLSWSDMTDKKCIQKPHRSCFKQFASSRK